LRSKRPGFPTLSSPAEYNRGIGLPIYGICDRETLRKGALSLSGAGFGLTYKWSADNSAEVAKGWIKRGKTIGELAKQISVDGAILEKTIGRYNEFCKTGTDTDFHRAREALQGLAAPPYYAVELWPRLVNTMGGPRRDFKARVLNTKGWDRSGDISIVGVGMLARPWRSAGLRARMQRRKFHGARPEETAARTPRVHRRCVSAARLGFAGQQCHPKPANRTKWSS
jgi:FAD binding domain